MLLRIISIELVFRGRLRLLPIIAKIKTAERAENFFEYRGEFEQNKGVRAEFWAEKAIFMSTAGRQNKLFLQAEFIQA